MQKFNVDQLTEAGVMPVAIVSTTPFKTHFNKKLHRNDDEINDMPSMTEPDQSMTVKELVYRYTHGMSLGGGKVPMYEDDVEVTFPADWDKLDISEKHEFYAQKAEELREIQKKMNDSKNQLEEDRKRKELDDAVNEKLKTIRNIRKGGDIEEAEIVK